MPMNLYRFSFFEHEDDDISTTIAIFPAADDMDAFKRGLSVLPKHLQNAVELSKHCAEQRGEAYDPESVETAFFSANELESLDELSSYAGTWWDEHAKLFGPPVDKPTATDLAHTITVLLT